MIVRTLEIYYDIDMVVPHNTSDDRRLFAALDFRNAAMDHIEAALVAEGLGEWVGAEIGVGQVSIGFDVEDFDAAEAVIRNAVKDTPFDCIRRLERREFSNTDAA